MAYPKYIKDIEDGCVLKWNEGMEQYENELEGSILDIEDYKDYKKYYTNSNEEEYNKYNKSLTDDFEKKVYLTNSEWEEVLDALTDNDNYTNILNKIQKQSQGER